jgi:uncharacterized cupin superfamily protein
MRRLVLLSFVFAAASCALPVPCTRALCPTRVEGTYRVSAWKGVVTVTPSEPAVPVVSDEEVSVVSGQIEFVNNDALIRASEGAVFHLEVSTAPKPVPELYVSSGTVIVAQAPGQSFETVAPGTRWLLPRSPKAKW